MMMYVARQQPAQRLLLCLPAAFSVQAQALGLGPLTVHSSLGHPLQARVPVHGLAAEEASTNCLKARVVTLDGSVLSRPTAELTGSSANAAIRISGREGITEPAVSITVEIGCASAVRREYQVLLDPAPAAQTSALPASGDPTPRAAQPAPVKARIVKPVPASSAAAVERKTTAPSRPGTSLKTGTTGKSMLTLSSDDAEIEQVRSGLVLRHATNLSEPRTENDPARLAALRADQQRVAALLRGENPSAGVQSQLRDAQLALKTSRQDALEARRQLDDERKAWEAQRQQLMPRTWAGILAALALAGITAGGWLLHRRRQDQRRHQDALSMLAMPFDDATPETNAKPAAERPIAGPTPEAAAIPPEAFEWGAHPHDMPVATSPPQALDMPASWQLIEQQINGLRGQTAVPDDLAMPLMADGAAQSHATEVADMLLAAESWMAEHNPKRAADLLQPYLEREDMLSPAPGLYLLTLYRTLADDARIQTIKAQLEPCFPAEVGQWSAGAQTRHTMADFPEVQEMADTLKDSQALLPYLKGLLLAPQPFDFSTYRDIVRSIGLAAEVRKKDEIASMSLDFH